MKTFAFFLVILCFAAYSSATLKLLRPRARIVSLARPVTRYRPVNYVQAPLVVSKPVPVPAVYAQPAPIVTTHVSTYSAVVPAPATTYALSAPSYEVPITTYSVPATTYGVGYHSPAVTYGPPALGWTETVPTFDEPIYEDYWRYSAYAKSYKY